MSTNVIETQRLRRRFGEKLAVADLSIAVGRAEGYAFTFGAMGSASTNFYNDAFERQGYGDDVRAVQGLDLRVEAGEVFGFLGPNGAGKSTTIRILLDLIRATEGNAALLGLDSRRAGVQARRRVGYLPGDLCLYDRLIAREQLDSLARLRGSVDAGLRDELCERFGVVLDRTIRQLSKGNRQKVGACSSTRPRSSRCSRSAATSRPARAFSTRSCSA